MNVSEGMAPKDLLGTTASRSRGFWPSYIYREHDALQQNLFSCTTTPIDVEQLHSVMYCTGPTSSLL